MKLFFTLKNKINQMKAEEKLSNIKCKLYFTANVCLCVCEGCVWVFTGCKNSIDSYGWVSMPLINV